MPRHSRHHSSRHARFARVQGIRGFKLYALIALICLGVATLMQAVSLMSQKAEQYAQTAVQSAVNRRVADAVEAQRFGR